MTKKGRGNGGLSYGDPPAIKDVDAGLALANDLLQLKLAMDRVSKRLTDMRLAERFDTPFGALRHELRYVATSVTNRFGDVLQQVKALEEKGTRIKDVAASDDGTKQNTVLRR